MTFFSCRLLITPIFPRRLSTVLSKFSHKNRVSPPGWCHPGRSAPAPSDATATTTTSTVIFSAAEFEVTDTDRRQCLLAVEAVQREVDALTCLGTYQPWTAGGAGRRTGLRPSRHQITGLGLEGKSAVQGTRVTVSADNCTQSFIFILSRLIHDVSVALKCRIS